MASPSPLRFLLLLATTTAVGVLGIFLFNWAGPGAGAKRQTKEWYVSRLLLEGKHLVPPDHLDEAEQRWSMAIQVEKRPDIAVLGSSHGLLVSQKQIPAPGLLNLCISGACQADNWVTTRLLQKRNLAPRVMLVFVDPWLFNRNTDWGLWYPYAEELIEFEALLCRRDPSAAPVFTPNPPTKRGPGLRKLFSLSPLFSYFDDLYGYLPFNLREVADPDKVAFTVLRSDGGRQLNADKAGSSGPSTAIKARREFSVSIDPHRYGTFARIDPMLWRLFRAWLQECKAQGSEVWLVQPPYHPAIYKTITATPDNQLDRIQLRTTQLAEELGAKLFGSYNPETLGLDDECFLDGDHLSELGTKRLMIPVAQAWSELNDSKTP